MSERVLVCERLDRLMSILTAPLPELDASLLDAITLVNEIRNDCERMEAKLVSRKAEVERLRAAPGSEET